MKREILTLLREREGYLSGQELCEHFGVSRTAVWKAIESLKKEGYAIEAVRNRGYRLAEGDQYIFAAEEIERRLSTVRIGRPLYFYKEIDSTNLEARRFAAEGEKDGAVFVADRQVAGRGRRGRAWDSPSGINIYFTVLLRPQIQIQSSPQITLVMALAVLKGMERLYQEAVPGAKEQDNGAAESGSEEMSSGLGIKWPNDIVVNGRKVCGILTEMDLEEGFIRNIVVGVGINACSREFDEELKATATTLEDAWGMGIDRSKLLCFILEEFEKYETEFVGTESLAFLKSEYEQYLVNCGKVVRVLDPKEEYTGVARGITDSGELLVEREAGEVVSVFAGEVSVRGVYGYV